MISYSDVMVWRPFPDVLAMTAPQRLPRSSTKATPGSCTSLSRTASSSPMRSTASIPCPRRSICAPVARSTGKRSTTTTSWPPRTSQ